MSEHRSRPAVTTVVVAAVDLVIGGMFLLAGVIITLLPSLRLAATAAAVLGVTIVLITAWTLILGMKLLARRPWARWWSLITHGLFLLILIAPFFTEGGATGTNVVEFIALAGINLMVIVLLLLPVTSRNFALAEQERGP